MLATEVRDPGVGLVTVTRAKVTGDLSLARVYWTIIGDAEERKKTQKALERAAGFVRHLLAERLSLRRVPEVKFIFDESVAAQDRIEQNIQEISRRGRGPHRRRSRHRRHGGRRQGRHHGQE